MLQVKTSKRLETQQERKKKAALRDAVATWWGKARREGCARSQSRDDVPKKGRDEHNQRDVEREAGARLVAVHREGLVAVGQHR